jgi:hypothetical protein
MGKEGKAGIDYNRKRLHRVFLDRRPDRGGRFYGPWYQGIPKEYRERILINGSPVCEPDFSGYHPRMLYAKLGLSFPGDPYRLEGYPDTEGMRSFLKPLLLMIVNSRSEMSAIRAMRQKLRDEVAKDKRWGRKSLPLPVEIDSKEQYREVMSKLMELHKPIERFFFSDMSTELQFLDSQIAEAVMLYFAHYYNISVLPVHDSFIVDFRFADQVEEFMSQLAEQHLGQPFAVKSNMGGIKQNMELAEKLAAAGTPDEFRDRFMGVFKDNPEREKLLGSLENEARERVNKLKGQ